jgi:hypothetical protein
VFLTRVLDFDFGVDGGSSMKLITSWIARSWNEEMPFLVIV